MSWLSNLFGTGLTGVMNGVKELADEFFTSDEERAEFELKAKALMQARLTELEKTARRELEAKQEVIVAELNTGDKFVRRARPSLVYFGCAIILVNYTIAPIAGTESLELPAEFWIAWGSVVGMWSVGRSAERIGLTNSFTRKVTGSKEGKSLFDV